MLNQTQDIYESEDFFILRSPLLSYQEYRCINEGANSQALIEFFKNHSLFQEAIAIASPVLYQSIQASVASNPSDKICISILKFFFTRFYPLFCKDLMKIPFLPRVRYLNIILSPARWFFNYENLDIKKSESREAIVIVLRNVFKKNDVSEFVYLTHFDHRLLVNWNDQKHLELIAQHLMTHDEIILFEKIGKGDKEVIAEPKYRLLGLL